MPGDGEGTGAGARCGCGRAVDAGHRYCPRCGSLVGHLDGEAPSVGADLVLLSPASGQVADSARADGLVRTGRSTPARLAAVGAMAVLGLLAWGLFRQPSGEIAPEPPSGDEAAAGKDGKDGEDGEDGGETDDGATTTTRRSRTTRSSTSTAPPTTVVLSGAAGTPGLLLGEETGLSLVIGSAEANGVQVLDLDTGELRVLRRPRGHPLGRLGSSVVLSSNDGGVLLVDLTEPDKYAIRVGEGPQGWTQLVQIAEDRIWVIEQDSEGGAELLAYDESGKVVERPDLPSTGLASYLSYPGGAARPPELIYQPARGLYRREGAGYRLLAEGRAMTIGERVVLMEQCDESMVCQRRWYDTDDGRALDHPAPAADDGQATLLVVGDDRWLVRFDWQDGQSALIDIATGRTVRTLAEPMFGPFGPGVAVSDDGRWLVDRGQGGLIVIDLDTGVEWPLDGLTVNRSMGSALIDTVGSPAEPLP